MNRRNLFKGLFLSGIFSTVFATRNKAKDVEYPQRLCTYADIREDIYVEANLPYGRYKINIEDKFEVRDEKSIKKVTISKI